MDTAVHRRLHEELGLTCPLRFLFKFQYQAQFDAGTAERELCSVYIGRSDGRVRADPAEIHAWRWIDTAVLESQMASPDAPRFTPWFRLEWERLWREHRAELLALR
jgi:isopentenyl-diphosphate delta-isomerase